MMRPAKIFLLVLLASAVPSLLQAQDAGTRAGQAEQQRRQKAQQLQPYTPGRLERTLIAIEENYLAERWFNPPRGLFLRTGGMPEGQGLSFGPAYRYSTYAASLTLTSAVSVRRAWEVAGRLEFPRPKIDPAPVFLSVGGLYHHLPQEDFFGPGLQTTPAGRTSFLLDESSVDVTAGVSPARWFTLSGTAEYRSERPGPGKDPRRPSIEALYDDADAAGFQTDLDFVRLGGQAYVNAAPALQGAPVGGRYLFSLNRYLDRTADSYSFNRWDVDLQQYVPLFTPARLIALRAHAAGVVADDGQGIPFYLLPTLGGSHSIRGYRVQRFRGRNSLLLQAEYRFGLNDFMSGALFYDAGKVTFDRKDLWNRDDFRDDYGFSLRFGFMSLAALRAEVVFGGDEGTVFALRFGDVF
jgi:hypothetical protein